MFNTTTLLSVPPSHMHGYNNLPYEKKREKASSSQKIAFRSISKKREWSATNLWVNIAASASEEAIMERLYVFVCMYFWTHFLKFPQIITDLCGI